MGNTKVWIKSKESCEWPESTLEHSTTKSDLEET